MYEYGGVHGMPDVFVRACCDEHLVPENLEDRRPVSAQCVMNPEKKENVQEHDEATCEVCKKI